MGRRSIKQYAFNSGIWDKRLMTRTDLERYHYSCLELENFNLHYSGTIERRSGFRTVLTGGGVCRGVRIFPFYSSVGRADNIVVVRWDGSKAMFSVYNVETGGYYTSLSGELGSSGVLTDDISDIRCAQSYDEMYFTSRKFPALSLVRKGSASFSLDYMQMKAPPIEETDGGKLSFVSDGGSTASGTGSLTFVSPEDSDYSSSVIGPMAVKDNQVVVLDGVWECDDTDKESKVLPAFGKVTLATSGKWSGKLSIMVSYDDGETWTVAASIVAPEDGSLCPSTSVDIDEFGALVKVKKDYISQVKYIYITQDGSTGVPSETGVYEVPVDKTPCRWTLTCFGEQVFYFVPEKVGGKMPTTDSDGSFSSVRVKSVPPCASFSNKTAWQSVFNNNNYPRAIEIGQQRLWFCGNPEKTKTVWGSETDNIDVFRTGTKSTSAVEFTPVGNMYDSTCWFKTMRNGFAVGCSKSEMTVLPASSSGVITPTSISMKVESSWGSEDIDAVVGGDNVFYVRAGGRELVAMRFNLDSDSYRTVSVQLFARSIFENDKIKKIDYSRLPVSSIYVLTESGAFYRFVFNDEESISAWSKMTVGTCGEDVVFDDFCIMRSGDVDKLYVSARLKGSSGTSLSLLCNDSEDYLDHLSLTDGNGKVKDLVSEYYSTVVSMPIDISGDGTALGGRCVIAGVDVYGDFGCGFEYSLDGGKHWDKRYDTGFVLKDGKVVQNHVEDQLRLLSNGGYQDYAQLAFRTKENGPLVFYGYGAEVLATK